jgi:multiple sugar transport system ATP-binding protein
MVYVTHDQVEAMTLADKIVLLRPAGERDRSGAELPSIAQVGHPLELYHHPANAFVAGFIGSPGMNFMSATVQGLSDGGVTLRTGRQPCQARVAANGLAAGEAVTLGIRPEHVRLGQGPGQGQVTHVERLGEHAYVYLNGDEHEPALLAKTSRDDLRVGDRLSYTLPPEALHLFRLDGRAQPRLAVAP